MKQKIDDKLDGGTNIKSHIMQNFEELKFVDNINCSQLGPLRLYRFHPFFKYMACKLVCSVPSSQLTKEYTVQLMQKYHERCKIKQPHIIQSIGCESQTIMKSTSLGQVELFQIYLYFEFNQLSLENLIQQRRQQNSLLPEIEVWCLIKGIISALLYLQQQEISHGMISMQNICFDEENLLYRLYDQELIIGKWGSCKKYQQHITGMSDNNLSYKDQEEILSYLSPECSNCTNVDQLNEINSYKSDVYSFGVVLVYALSLKQYSSLAIALKWIPRYYSVELFQIINLCLTWDPKLRPDWLQLFEYIQTIPLDIQSTNLPVEEIQLFS